MTERRREASSLQIDRKSIRKVLSDQGIRRGIIQVTLKDKGPRGIVIATTITYKFYNLYHNHWNYDIQVQDDLKDIYNLYRECHK